MFALNLYRCMHMIYLETKNIFNNQITKTNFLIKLNFEFSFELYRMAWYVNR